VVRLDCWRFHVCALRALKAPIFWFWHKLHWPQLAREIYHAPMEDDRWYVLGVIALGLAPAALTVMALFMK
jgi:hypothetical protein